MDIMSLIGNYAFPIVACIVMAWYVKYITDKNQEEISKLNDQHTSLMLAYKDELSETINNNTLVMQKLCDNVNLKISNNKKKKGEEKNEIS